MKLLIVLYADDLKSASTTTPLELSPSMTLANLKTCISQHAKPLIPVERQVLSVMRNGVLVRPISIKQKSIDADHV